MDFKIISDGKHAVAGSFDKRFENDNYEVYFNTKSGLEVLKGKNGVDPFYTEWPLLMDVGIMGSCPNRCSFCYQGSKSEPHMTFNDFQILIDQTKHHVNQVALGGRGDPNLHPDFERFVTYARLLGVVPNYTTSGYNITNEQIEISKRYCGAVAVSDYSSPITYNTIHRLINAGIKTNIHLIFNKMTAVKCMDIIQGYEVYDNLINLDKLNAVIFLLFKPQGSGKELNELIPTVDQLKRFSELIYNSKAKFKVGMDSCLVNHTLKYTDVPDIQRIAVDTCESSRMSVYVTPSMKMVPCSFADHDKWGVQIDRNDPMSIYKIWNQSKTFKGFRSILEVSPEQCPVGL